MLERLFTYRVPFHIGLCGALPQTNPARGTSSGSDCFKAGARDAPHLILRHAYRWASRLESASRLCVSGVYLTGAVNGGPAGLDGRTHAGGSQQRHQNCPGHGECWG
jgi:hypothetical protein